MKKCLTVLLSAFMLLMVSCAKNAIVSKSRPDSYYAGSNLYDNAQHVGSLFTSEKKD